MRKHRHIYYVLDLYESRILESFGDEEAAERHMVKEGNKSKHTLIVAANLVCYQGRNGIKMNWKELSKAFTGR